MSLYNKSLKVCNKESSCVQFNFQGRITSLNYRRKTQIQNRIALKELCFSYAGKTFQDRQVGKDMNHSQTAFNINVPATSLALLHLWQARKKRQMLNLTLLPRSYCQSNIARSYNIFNQLHHSSSKEHFQGINNQGKNQPHHGHTHQTPEGDTTQMTYQKELLTKGHIQQGETQWRIYQKDINQMKHSRTLQKEPIHNMLHKDTTQMKNQKERAYENYQPSNNSEGY